MTTESGNDRPPTPLRVVRGEPTADELAALISVVTARTAAGTDEPDGGPASAWTDRSRLVRRPISDGPHAWRLSARPG